MKRFFLFLYLLFFISIAHAENKKLTVLLDWFVNPNHAPLFVAEHQGFFKEAGLDVVLIGPADPSDPPKLVASGKADIAITYQPQFIQQVDHGLPLIAIGNLIDKPLNCLVVLSEGPIKNIKDLKGKTIGHSAGDVNSAALKVMLEKNGLHFNDVKTINVHYGLTQALLSKRVDAVTGMMRNFELAQLELTGHKGTAFFPEEQGLPTYSELIFVVNINKNKKEYSQFMQAVKKGIQYLKSHPEDMWVAFSKKYPELNNELNKRAWFATITLFPNDPSRLNKEAWLKFAEFMKSNLLINEVQPINRYIHETLI